LIGCSWGQILGPTVLHEVAARGPGRVRRAHPAGPATRLAAGKEVDPGDAAPFECVEAQVAVSR
jgi:hypothetical protein